MHETIATALLDHEFRLFQQFIRENSGIVISDVKRNLLQAKLVRRMTATGTRSYREYYNFLLNEDTDASEFHALIDIVTTNKTDFFREPRHFEFMRQVVMPIIHDKRTEDPNYFLRMWSTACATGEESYSLAIAVKKRFPEISRDDCRILATDISTRALERAIDGKYEPMAISKLPSYDLTLYLDTVQGPYGPLYRVKPELKELIEFRRFNLTAGAFPFRHGFDVIFCRNVLMYFGKETQKALVQKFYEVLLPGGFLFTGHAENLLNIEGPLRCIEPSIFVKE